MYCVASRSANTGMWEISVRNAEHNHGPYEPTPKKKKGMHPQALSHANRSDSKLSDMPPQHSSELVNLPLVQTPSYCTADFCLLPIGTGNPSVSREIAEVQRLLKRSGLTYDMNSGGTSVEGSWDDVMRIIGQAHSLLHGDGNGVVRIQTTIRVGTRMDKKQTGQDKLASVHALLNNEPLPRDTTDNGLGHDDPSEVHDHSQHLGQAMGPGSMPQIAPGLDSVGVPPPPTMGQPMAHHVHPQLPPHFNQRMPHMHLGHGTGL